MGLDVSHDCWHGAYSAFFRWREMIAQVAGLPPLELMEGFLNTEYGPLSKIHYKLEYQFPPSVERLIQQLPISWDCLKPDVLHALLNHSDCDGKLEHAICEPLANRLEGLLPLLPEGGSGGHIPDWREKTQEFIDGLRLAAKLGADVEFG